MFCPYCGKEMADNAAYCGFCGAKNETVKSTANPTYKDTSADSSEKSGSYTAKGADAQTGAQPGATSGFQAGTQSGTQQGAYTGSQNPTNQAPAPKKKMSAGKIILTVFICCTVVVVLIFSLIFATFKVVWDTIPWDKADSFVDEFEDYFDDYYDDFDEDDYYSSFHSNGTFTPGETDVEKNSYKSKFGGLDFSLPSTFETYSSSDIDELYDNNNVSSGEVKNYLTVYDFYSQNSISSTQVAIDYYNAEYYEDAYTSFDDFVEQIKNSIDDYGYDNDANISFAEDSAITLNGNEYTQIAARIAESDITYYEYDFMREVDGYYMKVTVFATDLKNVGEIIEILNGESK